MDVKPTIFRSTTITNTASPDQCEVTQGNDLTLLNCKTTFELYDSHLLSSNPYSLLNYGETRTIVGVRRSLESKHPGRLTYVQDNKMIKEAYLDENGVVQKDTILLVNSNNKTIDDAFVFDDVAAVKVTGYFFVFFKRPLSLSTYSTFLKSTAASAVGDQNITAWDFRPYKDGLQLFAVKKGTIYRYDFSFDLSATEVTTKQVFINYSKFDGVQYTVNVTPKEVIIACGDCSVPGVYFFDSDLKLFEGGDYPITNPSGRKLQLAVNF